MTHPRKQLRGSIKSLLEGIEHDGKTLTFEIARAAEIASKSGESLAFGDISTPSESSGRANKDRALERNIDLFVTLTIDSVDATILQDELDAWAELVEDRLRTNLPAPARRFTLTNTTLERSSDERGVNWVGILDMQFAAQILP